jgi:hypothetical protein
MNDLDKIIDTLMEGMLILLLLCFYGILAAFIICVIVKLGF